MITRKFSSVKRFVVLKRTDFAFRRDVDETLVSTTSVLTSETVQGTSLAFQGVHDVHGGDGLPLGVFGVSDCVSDYVLEEHFQDATRFFVDETADTFYTSATSETTDGGFGDALDVITQHFAMTFGATFTKTFASFTTSGHDVCLLRSILQRTRTKTRMCSE